MPSVVIRLLITSSACGQHLNSPSLKCLEARSLSWLHCFNIQNSYLPILSHALSSQADAEHELCIFSRGGEQSGIFALLSHTH